jgi:hypothetical protein
MRTVVDYRARTLHVIGIKLLVRPKPNPN